MAGDDSIAQDTFWETGEPLRKCRTCREMKPLKEFRSRYRHGRQTREAHCKKCELERILVWRKDNPGKHGKSQRKWWLRNKFGCSLEDYDRMCEAQGGVCAICRHSETRVVNGRVQLLSVDHDHETGAVRELLCNACNQILAAVEGNPHLLDVIGEAYVAYLKKHNAKSVRQADRMQEP